MTSAHRWVPYIVAGKPSASVKQATDEASGAYAIRRKDSHGVVYVGESDLGHLWRTLARHFQAPYTFTAPKSKKGGANAFATDRPEDYEVTWHITSRGRRSKKHGDQKAMNLQARWIRAFLKAGNKLKNKSDGLTSAQYTAKMRKEEAARARGDDSFDFGANKREWFENPSGALVALGRLTRMVVTPSRGSRPLVLCWAVSRAPVLAYDEAGKLHVVYMGRVERASTEAEIKEYKRTHWGAQPTGKVSGGGVAVPPWETLGTGVSITYTTKKGRDAELVDWVHPWGEGGPRKFTAPRIVAHKCRGGCATRCGARGSIALAGGTYSVSERGIVG